MFRKTGIKGKAPVSSAHLLLMSGAPVTLLLLVFLLMPSDHALKASPQNKGAAEEAAPAGAEPETVIAAPPLRRLRFVRDGKPVRLGVPLGDAEGILVRLDEAVGPLTEGLVQVVSVGRKEATLRIGSGAAAPLLRLPVESPAPGTDRSEPTAVLQTPGAAADQTVPLPLGSPVRQCRSEEDPQPRAWVDLHSLAGLLGVTIEEVGETVYLTTPAYWSRVLGLPVSKGDSGSQAEELTRRLTLKPEIGISPPARTALLWARPPQESFVQIYALGAAKAREFEKAEPVRSGFGAAQPEPMLGYDNFGEDAVLPKTVRGSVASWPADPVHPARFQTQFYETDPSLRKTLGTSEGPDAEYALYAAVVTRVAPPGGDAIQAIRQGKIPTGDWSVVGIRQRIGSAFVLYDTIALAPGQTLEDIASQRGVPLPLLLTINGLKPSDTPAAGIPLLVPRQLEDRASQAAVEWSASQSPLAAAESANPAPKNAVSSELIVGKGENLDVIAKKTGMSVASLQSANDLATGEEVKPGDSLQFVSLNNPPRPELKAAVTAKWVPENRWATTTKKLRVSRKAHPLDLQESIATLPAGTRVRVIKSQSEWRVSKVEIPGDYGFVASSFLGPDLPAPASRPPVSAPAAPVAPPAMPALPAPGRRQTLPLGGTREGYRIVQEALRWEGVPRYVWGGNNIRSGIDCSHFVAAVYALAGVACPSPPVHEMEQYGDLIDWKNGDADDHGVVRHFPRGWDYRFLRPGDRIIFQSRLGTGEAGSHHVGIYIGAFRGMPHAVIHCNSSRKTVSVDNLTSPYLGRIYRYAVRGSRMRPAGGWKQAGSTPTGPSPSLSALPRMALAERSR